MKLLIALLLIVEKTLVAQFTSFNTIVKGKQVSQAVTKHRAC